MPLTALDEGSAVSRADNILTSCSPVRGGMGVGEKEHDVFLFTYFCVMASFSARMFHDDVILNTKHKNKEKKVEEEEEEERGIGKHIVSGVVVRG